MKIRSSLLSAATACVLLTGSSHLFAVTSEPAKPVLEKGMDAATVVSLYGRPAEIQPIKHEETSAEKWIYRRKARVYTDQVASGVTMIPAFIGINGTGGPIMAETPILDFKTKFITVYQITALLMIDGKLERGKQWAEREEKFTN